MILKIFTVHDSKAEAFITPFFCPTSGVAIRNFEAAANEEGHAFHNHASDYTLFEIGEFDDQSADVRMLASPVSLGLAINYIKGNESAVNVPSVRALPEPHPLERQ